MRNNFKSIFILFLVLIFSFALFADNTWILKIDSKTYYYNNFIEDFNLFIETSFEESEWESKRNDKDLIKKFFDSYVNQELLYQKIEDENFITLNQRIIKDQKRQQIVKIWLVKELIKQVEDPTDDEIAEFYNKYQQNFANMDIETAEKQIKLRLKMEKLNKLKEKILNRKRESTIIKKNEAFFDNPDTQVDWVLKIGDETISYFTFKKLFDDYMKFLANSKQLEDKTFIKKQLSEFANQYIENYLLYQNIIKTNFIEENKDIIEYTNRKQIIQFFIQRKIKDQNLITISPEQINQTYQAYKNNPNFQGKSEAQIKQMIYQQLIQQQMMYYTQKIIQDYKDESIIKKNYEFLDAKGITS